MSDVQNIEKVLSFLNKTSRLKKTYRYKEHEELLHESCSDHSWRLAFMTMILSREMNLDIDTDKAVKMALIHDVAESVNDDISAYVLLNNKTLSEEKRIKEDRAMSDLGDMLPEMSGNEFLGLWKEFNEAKTPESRFVKALDRIEGVMHTMEVGNDETKKYDDFRILRLDNAADLFPPLNGLVGLLKSRLNGKQDGVK